MSVNDIGNAHEHKMQLKRNFGLLTACSLIVGGVVGSGIFVSPQGVLLGAGSYGLSLIIWTVCGILSLCGALTYAEMGTIIPKSGSAYYYIKEIYGDCAAFVYMFTFNFFAIPGGRAIVALTWAEYLTSLFPGYDCGNVPSHITKVLATTMLIFVGAINCKSVLLTGNVSVIFTVGKILGLGVIILGGFVYLFSGFNNYLSVEHSFTGSTLNIASLAEAILSGMWAYSGWDGLNYLTEELKRPERNLALSILISMPIITTVYLLANVAYFSVLAPTEIMVSSSVAKTWAYSVLPKVGWFVPIAVIVSTFGTSVCNLLLNSRLVFVAARENHLPGVFSMIHVKYFTPAPAVFLMSVLSVVYVYFGTIVQLIEFTGVAVWFFHGMVGVGLFIMRFKRENVHRPYKAPIICPIVLVLFCIPLSLAPIIGNPQWGYFFALFVLIFASILWFLGIKLKLLNHVPGMAKTTEVIQMLAQVVPSEQTSD